MADSGWDWDAIERSDYPVVTEPSLLRRDVVYCEFWTVGTGGAYGYMTGLVIPWLDWLDLRETPVGIPLSAEFFSPLRGQGVELYNFTRARFGIWTAFVNPRFPRHSLAVWSLESGFNRQGW